MRKSKGNTLAEYAITASILVPLTFAALPPLNQGLSQVMQHILMGSILQSNSLKITLLGENLQAIRTYTPSTVSPHPVVTGQNAQVQLSDGTKITLNNFPSTFQQAVETSGVNGATHLYANTIASVASQLLQEQKINQGSYQILMELANQGHSIASVQAILEQLAKTYRNDKNAFESQVIIYNGNAHTTKELAYLTDGLVLDNGNPLKDLASQIQGTSAQGG